MARRKDDVVLCRAGIDHAYFANGYLYGGELRAMWSNTCLTLRHVHLSCAKYAPTKGNISHSILYLNYSGIPLQVLLSSSYGNLTFIKYFNY